VLDAPLGVAFQGVENLRREATEMVPLHVRLPGRGRLLRAAGAGLARLGGVREWNSLEGDPRIEARHEYGHVQLRVTARKRWRTGETTAGDN
jgi:hypothetical protein